MTPLDLLSQHSAHLSEGASAPRQDLCPGIVCRPTRRGRTHNRRPRCGRRPRDRGRCAQQPVAGARSADRADADAERAFNYSCAAPCWRRFTSPQWCQQGHPRRLHFHHSCACSTSVQARTKPRPVAVRVSRSWRCASSVAPQHCPNCSAPAMSHEWMQREWKPACTSRHCVQLRVGSSWGPPAPAPKLPTRDVTQLWATRIWCRHRCRAALYLSTVTCTRTVARRCVRSCWRTACATAGRTPDVARSHSSPSEPALLCR